MNKMGPKIVSWGTPDITWVHDDNCRAKQHVATDQLQSSETIWEESHQHRIFLA